MSIHLFCLPLPSIVMPCCNRWGSSIFIRMDCKNKCPMETTYGNRCTFSTAVHSTDVLPKMIRLRGRILSLRNLGFKSPWHREPFCFSLLLRVILIMFGFSIKKTPDHVFLALQVPTHNNYRRAHSCLNPSSFSHFKWLCLLLLIADSPVLRLSVSNLKWFCFPNCFISHSCRPYSQNTWHFNLSQQNTDNARLCHYSRQLVTPVFKKSTSLL